MVIPPDVFPLLPKDTAYVANAVFGKRHVYLTIGDQLPDLLARIDLAPLEPFENAPTWTLAFCALVTILQFVESLPDGRVTAASRTRVDWKYVLRLPLAYPGFDSRLLYEFRQHLIRHPAAQSIFQQLLDRLADAGLFEPVGRHRIETTELLAAVCAVNDQGQ
jgi:transposase